MILVEEQGRGNRTLPTHGDANGQIQAQPSLLRAKGAKDEGEAGTRKESLECEEIHAEIKAEELRNRGKLVRKSRRWTTKT